MNCLWCHGEFKREGKGSGRKNFCSDFCRFMSKVHQTPLCWIWQGSHDSNGYGIFWSSLERRKICAHTASVLLVKREMIPEGLEVRHLCHNKACVRPEHLVVGTRSENRQDSIRDKGHYIGENHSQARLTTDDVKKIRTLVAKGMLQKDLAEQYGVSKSTINLIALRKNWKHV